MPRPSSRGRLDVALGIDVIRYAVDGWGVGELGLDGDLLLWHELPTEHLRPSGAVSHPLASRFRRYFAGGPVKFDDIVVDLSGCSPFHQELAVALRRVPRGEVVSYGELAAMAGRPRAQRAAGTFCAANRHSIVVPCHRVVAASGFGSFGLLGVEYKRRLLALEGVERLSQGQA